LVIVVCKKVIEKGISDAAQEREQEHCHFFNHLGAHSGYFEGTIEENSQTDGRTQTRTFEKSADNIARLQKREISGFQRQRCRGSSRTRSRSCDAVVIHTVALVGQALVGGR